MTKKAQIKIAKGARSTGPFAPVEDAVAAIARGEMVIVVDDEDRDESPRRCERGRDGKPGADLALRGEQPQQHLQPRRNEDTGKKFAARSHFNL